MFSKEEISVRSLARLIRASKKRIMYIDSKFYRKIVSICEFLNLLIINFIAVYVVLLSGYIMGKEFDDLLVAFFVAFLVQMFALGLLTFLASPVLLFIKEVWVFAITLIFGVRSGWNESNRETAAYVWSGSGLASLARCTDDASLTDEVWAKRFFWNGLNIFDNLEHEIPDADLRNIANLTSPILFKERGFLRLFLLQKIIRKSQKDEFKSPADWNLFLRSRNLHETSLEKVLKILGIKTISDVFLNITFMYITYYSMKLGRGENGNIVTYLWDFLITPLGLTI